MQKAFNILKAFIRVLFFLLWTGLALMVFVVAIPLDQRLTIARLWHKGCLKLFAVKLKIIGEKSEQAPILFVANHVSYLDIIILGSQLKASFVSKAEVRKWPLFGWLSTLQNTVFINRRSREIKVQLKELSNRVSNQENLIIFPEGTSTDGKTVKPFKSSLFAICDLHPELNIQAIGLKYLNNKGEPLTDQVRDQYAFYADFPFGAHFWGMLQGSGVCVEVSFPPILNTQSYSNRKKVATVSQQLIYDEVCS